VLAACALLAVWATPALADDPFSVSLNHGFVNLGDDPNFQDVEILAPPDTATLSGTINLGTGAFTVPAGQLAPTKTFSFPNPLGGTVNGTIALSTTAPTTGNFNDVSGALSADQTLLTTLTLGPVLFYGPSKCLGTTTPAPITFSTANNLGGHLGDPFNEGLAGTGAMAAAWMDLSITASSEPGYSGSGSVCPIIDGYADGPGGAWLQNDPAPTPPAPPTGGGSGSGTAGVTAAGVAAPAAKKCKKGRKLRRGKCVKKKKKK
jgi:hypothetical protein